MQEEVGLRLAQLWPVPNYSTFHPSPVAPSTHQRGWVTPPITNLHPTHPPIQQPPLHPPTQAQGMASRMMKIISPSAK